MNNRSSLQKDNSENIIVTDSVSRLKSAGFDDSYIWHFTGSLVGILNDYAELIGEKTEVQYRLIKKFTKIELRIQIPGAQFDPFTSGSEAQKRMIEALTHINLNTELPDVSYKYQSGANVIFISVPLDRKKKKLYKDPMFLAVLSGVIVGLICLHLPESANSFIIDNVVSPLRSKILGAVSGIMGPVILYPLQPPLSRWAALTISHISACTMTYNMFEELEAAHKLGGMKEEAPDSAGEQ